MKICRTFQIWALAILCAGGVTRAMGQDLNRDSAAGVAVGAGAATGAAQGSAAGQIQQQGQAALGQSVQNPAITNTNTGRGVQRAAEPGLSGNPANPAAKLSTVERHEFQDFTAQSLGRELPMFGFNLFQGVPTTFAPLDRVPVTPDYILGPGDELVMSAWGQVDMDYRATVDRHGAISIPRVGNINVAGIRYQDIEGHVKRAVGRVFTNFELKVTLGQLRSISVFVVGQAARPGNYTVSSLSTLVNALFASGGPSLKGSMRSIQLKRGDKLITEFDMYDLLLKGDKSKDTQLLPGDVIYIPPTGQLVAISGSVNTPAIYEIRGRAVLSDLIDLAGGLTNTASGQKVAVERIVDRKTRKVEDFMLDKAGLAKPLQDGDFVKVASLSPRFDNAVTVRGNVAGAARHPWRSGMRVRDVIPDKSALIVHDYWIKRNLAIRADVAGNDQEDARRRAASGVQGESQENLRRDLRRSLPEVNWDYAVIERLNLADLTTMLIPFNLGKAILESDPAQNVQLQPGDVITIFSKDDLQTQVAKRPLFVKLEGEVAVAGVYQAKPGETLRQLVTRVGGLSPNAYLFGAEFERESTRVIQQKRLDEVVDRMEQEVQRNQVAKAALSKEEADSTKTAMEGQLALVQRLRKVKAAGRIVLEIPPEVVTMAGLPDLRLEDGDRFFVPAVPSTVLVLGTVYHANAFMYRPEKRLNDYLTQAGGPTKDADIGSAYVIRADGSVISKRQSGYFFSSIEREKLMPGDTIVVPESFDRFRWSKELRDWSQIFYQFALGVAGLKVLKDF